MSGHATPRLAIIADDLTGALDAAAPFCGVQGGVVVATDLAHLPSALEKGAGVVSVSTRSREIRAESAQERVAAALAALPPGLRFFKKVDSRLKGNIEAELAPFGSVPLLVSPAIPDLGRIVVGGSVRGHGIDAPIPIAARLGKAASQANIPDARTNADLANAVAQMPEHAVLVGARGLAQGLAEVLGITRSETGVALPAPLCLAVGSTDPITLEQVANLKSARSDLDFVAIPAGGLAYPPDIPIRALSLIQLVSGENGPPAEVAQRFATAAKGWLERARSMLLTGGATAEAVLDALQIGVIRVDGEILPGMPVCSTGEQFVITKSGGFGAPEALVQIADHVPLA